MNARSFIERQPDDNGAITLRELNRRVALQLSVPQLQNVWVTAELSDVRESGGHCYLELIDKNEATGIIDARLRGIIWASAFYKISANFTTFTGQKLATGLRVMVRGSVNYHAAYGMSFVINDINPSFTMGDVERRRREILLRLDAEGVLEQNRSLEWNVPTLRIAVVSAQGAAGYGDFINQLYSNSSSIKFVTRLFPAVLQGEKTAASVIAALDRINEDIDNWDCVVIIRGGGATSDLVSFDNYELAANVAQFPIPVVVGIGHERDVTVLDYIANVRVKTPTAAAEMLIARAEELISGLRETAADMLLAVNDKISGCTTQLAYLEAQLPVAPVNAIERKKLRLDSVRSTLFAMTTGRITPQLAQLDKMPQAISLAIDNLLARRRDRLAASESLLQALSPMATLKRGYTITRIGGKIVSSVGDIKQGDTIETIFSDGKIKSIITE